MHVPCLLTLAIAFKCAAAALILLSITNAKGGDPSVVSLAVSDFDDPALGADGWMQLNEGSSPTALSYLANGGTTDGGISSTSGTGWLVAPPRFLGDKHRAYCGVLRFDMRQNKLYGYGRGYGIRLHSAGGLMLGAFLPQNAPTSWTSFEFELDENHGWYNRNAGRLATRDEILKVLSNLDAIWIRADNTDSADSSTSLDNIQLLGQPSAGTETELSIRNMTVVTVNGEVGVSYRIEFKPSLDSGIGWTKLTDVLLAGSPYQFVDTESASQPIRFYRVVKNN